MSNHTNDIKRECPISNRLAITNYLPLIVEKIIARLLESVARVFPKYQHLQNNSAATPFDCKFSRGGGGGAAGGGGEGVGGSGVHLTFMQRRISDLVIQGRINVNVVNATLNKCHVPAGLFLFPSSKGFCCDTIWLQLFFLLSG